MTASASTPPPTLHHTGITVPDLVSAIAFFTEHFDACLEFQLGDLNRSDDSDVTRLGAPAGSTFRLAMLRVGSARIELLQWAPGIESRLPLAPNAHGATHLGIIVRDLEGTLARLRALPDATVLSEPLLFREGPTPGLRNAFVTAPWGLLIELMHWQGLR